MRYLIPDYYEKFTCLGTACRDNCCIGWEIEVDEDSWQKYQRLPGQLGDKLRRCIACDAAGRHFILENQRCPLLTAQNRCQIILELGEEALCDICDEHPRFSFEYTGWIETGLGLCCEEAARLILSNPQPAAFLCTQTENSVPEPPLEESLQQMLNQRFKLFALLQNRDYPLSTRLRALLMAEEAGRLPEVDVLLALTSFFQTQEYLTPEWGLILQNTAAFLRLPEEVRGQYQKDFMQLLPAVSIEYEQLAVYFLFRYYLSAYFDHRPAEKVRFTAAAVTFIATLAWAEYASNQVLPDFSRRLRLAQLFSKEVEYSSEVLEGMCELLMLE